MQRALEVLAAEDPSIKRVMHNPTDYYVKFNLRDSVQMGTLEGLSVELLNHPLYNSLYTETEPGDISEDSPIIYEPLYCVVTADFVFPEAVDYETIRGVFIRLYEFAE